MKGPEESWCSGQREVQVCHLVDPTDPYDLGITSLRERFRNDEGCRLMKRICFYSAIAVFGSCSATCAVPVILMARARSRAERLCDETGIGSDGDSFVRRAKAMGFNCIADGPVDRESSGYLFASYSGLPGSRSMCRVLLTNGRISSKDVASGSLAD